MIPKGFKIPCSLYTEDFETEVYTLEPTDDSYRIDIHIEEFNANYTYHCRVFGLDGHLLTINGWTLNGMSFHRAWNENYPPVLELHNERGNSDIEYRLAEPFSKKLRNAEGGTLERRLRETWSFFVYVSGILSLEMFRTIYASPLETVEDVMKYYLECLKVKELLPSKAWCFIENTVKKKFEYFIEHTNIKVERK